MKTLKPLILFILFFFSWIALISSLWSAYFLLFLILAFISIMYLLFSKDKDDIKYYVVAAISGPIGEILVSSSGLWKYQGETILGIPYWLPLAWGITALAIKKFIQNIPNKRKTR